MEDSAPRLVPIPHLGENHGAFFETARWDAFDGDQHIGQVWKAVRHDGVVCWMQRADAVGHSMPCSGVIGGYARTSKKGALSDLVSWHRNRPLTVEADGWTIHCCRNVDVPNGAERTYLAMRPGHADKWLHASHNETEKPFRGAMGGIGWHVTGYRGQRMVVVHDADDLDEALRFALDRIAATPFQEEAVKYAHRHLEVERHYPQATEATPASP